MNINTPNT